MEIIANILLATGALAAGFYCFVLSRRLTAFKSAEGGIGAVVAKLSAQVDDLSASVATARSSAQASTASLQETTNRAESVAQRLELMIASMHDIPQSDATEQTAAQPVFATRASRAAGQQ